MLDDLPPVPPAPRPISVRLRFEVFKRDAFTCRYCGRASPEVVLEVDHVIPVCDDGSNDEMNLVTACWECNRGKSHVPLTSLVTGEDPHERAVMLLERERQLVEYNAVLATVCARVDRDAEELALLWEEATGGTMYEREFTSLKTALSRYPSEAVRQAMDAAIRNGKTRSLAYVHGCLKNWSES